MPRGWPPSRRPRRVGARRLRGRGHGCDSHAADDDLVRLTGDDDHDPTRLAHHERGAAPDPDQDGVEGAGHRPHTAPHHRRPTEEEHADPRRGAKAGEHLPRALGRHRSPGGARRLLRLRRGGARVSAHGQRVHDRPRPLLRACGPQRRDREQARGRHEHPSGRLPPPRRLRRLRQPGPRRSARGCAWMPRTCGSTTPRPPSTTPTSARRPAAAGPAPRSCTTSRPTTTPRSSATTRPGPPASARRSSSTSTRARALPAASPCPRSRCSPSSAGSGPGAVMAIR